jgi:hypothetical protein
MRKLVTVRKITDIKPIAGADFIEEVWVSGWSVVCQKGIHKVNNFVVYFELDSFLPESDKRFESFMKFGTRTFNGVVGHRIKTVRLKGVYSQGVIMPISEFPELGGVLDAERDYSEELGIVKWEAPEFTGKAGKFGDAKGNFPWFLRKTDQERIQNLYGELVETHQDVDFVGTLKMDGCFLGNTLIETWEGASVKISDIVNKGLRPTLIGVNSLGEVVPCEVTKVFNNGHKGNWINLKYEPYQKSRIVGRGGNLKITPNHKVFLEDLTEISASEVKVGNKLLMQHDSLNAAAKHYVYSALLGDGCVCGKYNKHNFFTESKLSKHVGYLDILKEAYGDLFITFNKRTSGYGSEITYLSMKRTFDMDEIRKEWYTEGVKKLPEDISWLDDFSLAKWYLDDGSLSHSESQNDRALLATNTFSLGDVERLKIHLEVNWGLDVSIQNAKGYSLRINFSNGSIRKFWDAISKYIPSDFKYKLPEEYRGVPFTGYPRLGTTKKLVSVNVTEVSTLDYNEKNFPQGAIGYDIETTTHNYFCNGLLVHNSSIQVGYVGNERFGEPRVFICSRNLELKYAPEADIETQGCFIKGAVYSDLFNKAKELYDITGNSYSIQGELVGNGIQGNFEKFEDYQVFAYNIFNIDVQEYVSFYEFESLCDLVGIQTVPVVYCNQPVLRNSLQDILILSNVQGLKAEYCEGIVWKSVHGITSFKVISNRYLEKQK